VFSRLVSEGRRVRRDDLSVRWIIEDEAGAPCVAYAIGRKVGSAVVRNRIRRRLRVLVEGEAHRGLPNGWYLVGAGSSRATQPAATLRSDVAALFSQIRVQS